MQIACKTDVGLVREHNEDCCVIGEHFAIVADGMGGHNKGEVASGIASDVLSEKFSNAESVGKELLVKAVEEANSCVYKEALSNPDCAGMGTTVVAAVWDDKKVIIGHIGDSRAYEVSKNGITLLTKDHTLVQALIDDGKLTLKEAENYPDRHVITRAVGTDPVESPDVVEIKRKKNHWLVLCSDGLTNHVTEAEIKECIEKTDDADKAVETLVDMANSGGGTDNITVAVVRL